VSCKASKPIRSAHFHQKRKQAKASKVSCKASKVGCKDSKLACKASNVYSKASKPIRSAHFHQKRKRKPGRKELFVRIKEFLWINGTDLKLKRGNLVYFSVGVGRDRDFFEEDQRF
jgi:hypothetical protein